MLKMHQINSKPGVSWQDREEKNGRKRNEEKECKKKEETRTERRVSDVVIPVSKVFHFYLFNCNYNLIRNGGITSLQCLHVAFIDKEKINQIK